jgi:multimeric flavodoxin WrbA
MDSIKVLGLSTSPRAKGNSDLLLREALAGAEQAGARCEYVSLRGLSLAPCVACNSCYRTGVCRIQDDYQPLFAKMLAVDRIIFATPVFFMSVCTQAKLLIDRCQCLWSRKYVLKEQLFETGSTDRRGMVIAVGGSKSQKMFESIALTMKYYFDVLDVAYVSNLFVNQLDASGEVLAHPTAMGEARRLGGALAIDAGPPPRNSIDVGLF